MRPEGRIQNWRRGNLPSMPGSSGQLIALAKKFIVMQDLAQLRDVYGNTPPLFHDETGKPGPDGSTIRAPDGKLTRAMTITDDLAALRPFTDQR